jgi:hypothetical protein
MSDEHEMVCGGCGEKLSAGATICPACGWDLTTSVGRPRRRGVLRALAAGGWRVVLYGVILALPLVGFLRLQATGPGPDLATTLRWLALGDDGRAAELVTIHRAHEIGKAAARFAVLELEPPGFEGDWDTVLADHSTMIVRGWIPALFVAGHTEMSPGSVRELYRVRRVDGWGRPYRVITRLLVRDEVPDDDEQVAEDLRRGLSTSFFTRGEPELAESDWMRLELVSAGRDGRMDSDDDIRFISYFATGLTLQLRRNPADVRRELDRAYATGRQYFRLEGNRYDLIDARLLAEFRLTTLS